MLKIGITPRFVPGDGVSAGSSAVDRMAVVDANNQLCTRFGAIPLTLPMLREVHGTERAQMLTSIVESLDGLLLQGGTDIEPHRYGQTPIKPEWAGDPIRDRLEFDLLNAFLLANKPVLGVCRGFQLINVAFGGSMFQDIPTQHVGAMAHDTSASYCGCTHAVQLVEGGLLQRIYGQPNGWVNSAHHQGVNQIGKGLRAEAHAPDGICEALVSTQHRFVVAVQWHPEFHHLDTKLLSPEPLMRSFLAACGNMQKTEGF